jgi:hypothetical protein
MAGQGILFWFLLVGAHSNPLSWKKVFIAFQEVSVRMQPYDGMI